VLGDSKVSSDSKNPRFYSIARAHSNLGNGAGTSRNLFLKHSSEKEKS